MTTHEIASVEETLIKISLKSLYFAGTSLVAGAVFAVLLYSNIMQGQIDIMTEVKRNAIERRYQIQDLSKDIKNINDRVLKLEAKK